MRKLMMLALIASANLYAQEIKLNDSVIKGSQSYNGSVIENEKKNVVVIRKEDIEKKQYPDIVSIFKDSPVTMVTHTQAGPLIALRGSGEKTVMRVNILLNGMSINTMDESMGVIPFNAIPVNTIERIEIIPGGGVTLYGSGSSSGVINIVTNKDSKNSYGVVNANVSSFDTFNVSASKGIKLGEKVFLDLAVEGKKGKGYREKEKHKKLNLLAGVDVKLNDKHKFRLEGTKYTAKDNSTDELTHKELAKNRRGAGKSDFEVNSDRDSFTARYEYTPNKNWNISAAYNQSDFTRKIKQDNRPFITFLPSEGFNDFFGKPDGWEADLVLLNVHNKLDGSIREKIKNFKFKTDYKYNRGNLIFGYDKSKRELRREMNIDVLPFDPEKQLRNLLRPAWELVLDQDVLEKRGKDYVMDPNMNIFMLGAIFGEDVVGINNDKVLKYFNKHYKRHIGAYIKEMDEGVKDPEKNKRLKQALRESDYNNLLVEIEELKKIQEEAKTNPEALNKYEVAKNVFWKLSDTVGREKLKEFIDDGTTQIIMQGMPIDITPDMTVKEYMNTIMAMYGMGGKEGAISQTSIVNSWVDVKKDTDSFYLYNDFDVTDKLNIDAGLRYEKAKYNGVRHTDSSQVVSVEKPWDENGEIASELVGRYTGLSEAGTKGETTHDWMNDEYDIRMEELKEKGTTTIKMVEIDIANKQTETNIGGHLGLNYKLNDTDTIYGRYERAFNSPLPTQFTNKTIDPRTKMKTYWESHIKSENMDNFELGIRGAIGNNITYSIAGFMSNTKNEILSVVKNGSSHMMREWRYINLEKTRRMGIELQSQQIFDKLKLKESFTYVNPKILSNDMERSTRQVYEDALDISIKNVVKWEQDDMDRFWLKTKKEKVTSKVSLEDRKELSKKINKIYEDTANHRIDLATSKVKMEELVNSYKDKYKTAEGERFFEGVLKEATGEKWGDLKYLANHKTRMKEYYKDQLEAAIGGRFLGKGDQIPLTPKYKATFSADYQFTNKLNLGTNLTYIGSFTNAEPVNGYGIKTVKVPHHVVADLYGTYNVNEDFEVKFGVNNLFENKYYLRQDSKTATPAAGRTYNLGVTYRF